MIEYVDREVEVKVPVPCEGPDVNCSWSGNKSQLSAQMYACIINLRESIKVCQKEK